MTAPANQAFVPLPVGPSVQAQRGDFRVLVAERPETARPLSTLELPSGTGLTAHQPRSACEPRVTLQRDGNCITGIRIQCSCGQIVDLTCAYDVKQ